MKPRRVHLHIGRLQLRGVDAVRGEQLVAALTAALRRELGEADFSAPHSGANVEVLRLPALRTEPSADAGALGDAAGAALVRSLRR